MIDFKFSVQSEKGMKYAVMHIGRHVSLVAFCRTAKEADSEVAKQPERRERWTLEQYVNWIEER